MEKFIKELVDEWNEDLLTSGDVQDIIEGYCINNNTDYEELYQTFIRMRG